MFNNKSDANVRYCVYRHITSKRLFLKNVLTFKIFRPNTFLKSQEALCFDK